MTTPPRNASDSSSKDRVRLWIQLARNYALMLRELRHFDHRPELTLAQFDVMAQLLRHPEGLSAGRLAEKLIVTAGNLTGLADRLENNGWLERMRHPDDARVKILKLTAAGKRIARLEVERQEAKIASILDNLPEDCVRDLNEQLHTLRNHLHGYDHDRESPHHRNDLQEE